MIVTLKITDINPREDVIWVVEEVKAYLNRCAPEDRPDLKIERPI